MRMIVTKFNLLGELFLKSSVTTKCKSKTKLLPVNLHRYKKSVFSSIFCRESLAISINIPEVKQVVASDFNHTLHFDRFT